VKRAGHRIRRAAIAIVPLVLAAGCATLDPPRPWEKDRLAQPPMQFDADPLGAKATQHIYTSKEGSSGGYGIGGGGCGCN
jgi:hypothetical protein